MRIGLVLGGGGIVGGAWEIGALHALKQTIAWDPRGADCLVGTSAGALMAALLAAGVLPDLDLTDATTRERTVFPWPMPGSFELGLKGLRQRGPRRWIMTLAGLMPRGGLSTQPIQDAVRRRIPGGWPAGRQLWIVAADYRTGERVVFGRPDAPAADLPAAVAASCAMPGVYEPVEIGGRPYVDGGLYSAANLDLLDGIGLDLVICVNPMSSPGHDPPPRRLAQRLLLFAERAMHQRLMAEANGLQASGTRVILIEPRPADLAAMGFNFMTRKRSAVVTRTAERTVADQLRTAPTRELVAEVA